MVVKYLGVKIEQNFQFSKHLYNFFVISTEQIAFHTKQENLQA